MKRRSRLAVTALAFAAISSPGYLSAQMLGGSGSSSPLAQLSQRSNVARDILKDFQSGQAQSHGSLLLRGRLDRSGFYRPVLDDTASDQLSAYSELIDRYASSTSGVMMGPLKQDGTVDVTLTVEGALALSNDPRVFTLSRAPTLSQPGIILDPNNRIPLSVSLQSARFPQVPAYLDGSGQKIAVHDFGFDLAAANAAGVYDSLICPSFLNPALCIRPSVAHGHIVSTTIRRGNPGVGSLWGVGAAQGSKVVAAWHQSASGHVLDTLGQLAARTDVGVINMSWGSQAKWPSAASCDDDPNLNVYLGVLSQLRQSGKVLLAATGNSNNPDGISSPACLSPVIAVGGHFSCTHGVNCTYPGAQENEVFQALSQGTQYGSDQSARVDVVAPAGPVQVLRPGEVEFGPGAQGTSDIGTSFATPLVAACVARMRQANPSASVDQIRDALRASPTRAHHADNPAQSWPKLDCADAVARVQGSVSSIPVSNHNLTGTYYNPLNDGQGLIFNVSRLASGRFVVAAGWYTYDDQTPTGLLNQHATYLLQGEIDPGTTHAQVTLFRNTGGTFASGNTASQVVGSGTLSFESCGSGRLQYQFHSGLSGSMPLERLTAAPPNCESGQVPADARWQIGNVWYDPAASGQGLVIETNPAQGLAFGGWFTFAAATSHSPDADRQRWYSLVLQEGQQLGNGRILRFNVRQTTGGRFGTPSSVAPVNTITIGTATLTHTSCSSAQLNYNFRPTDTTPWLIGTINLAALMPRPHCGL